MKQKASSTGRIIRAARNSFRGICAAWQQEAAFRIDARVFVIFMPLSFWLARTVLEWLILIIPLFVLIVTELLNSAIENTVDRIGAERHILSRRAKDMGSAAVMFCLILIVIVWSSITWSRFHA